MMWLGDTTRGKIFQEAYSPTSRGSGRATEFERMPSDEGGRVAAGERSGRLIWEKEPGKMV